MANPVVKEDAGAWTDERSFLGQFQELWGERMEWRVEWVEYLKAEGQRKFNVGFL